MQVHFDIDRIALVAMDDVMKTAEDSKGDIEAKSVRQSLA